MYDTAQIKKYVDENIDEVYKIIYDLCGIPAPSHHEERRAEYCKAWFDKNGLPGSYIDEALNVILPYQADGSSELTVAVAHTDTVFPDMEPMPYTDDGEFIRSPGVGDDTTSLAVLMLVAKYFKENDIKTDGMLFVANSCEEGLGNLKGTRQIFNDFEGKIRLFVSFDSKIGGITDRCVGSHRYEVEVKTVGGHSYGAFGNPNAIVELSKLINEIYEIEVPKHENSHTTYNVGIVEGGTSVNTIAQNAKMLCEYRSDDEVCLAIMKENFERIFNSARARGLDVSVTLVGDRPCMGKVDLGEIEKIAKIYERITLEVTGKTVARGSGSTDCNIPLSLGIPSLCIGVYIGGGTHTRGEWIYKDSIIPGLEIAIKTLLALSEEM